MTDGRRTNVSAARVTVRRAVLLTIVGTASVFVANVLTGWLLLLVVPVIGTLWFLLAAESVAFAWRDREEGTVALVPLAVLAGALPVVWMLFWQGLYWSHVAPSWWLLRQERAAFQAAVAGRDRPPGVLAIERVGQRVAFPTVNGMLGAWQGIVFDPTGTMVQARGWGGGPVADDIRTLFGSRVIWCQRLDGPWFHCHFD